MTDHTRRFPGDATPAEIRTAADALRLFATHGGPDDWQRVRDTARWIADAADWQIRDAKTAAPTGRHWLADRIDHRLTDPPGRMHTMTDQTTDLPTGAGLISATLALARRVDQGDARHVEPLAAHGRALAYAYTFPRFQGVNGPRPDSGEPRVDLMRRVTRDGNGVLAVTAGEIRRTYGSSDGRVSIAGYNLCTLPAELPDDDQTPVILFSGIAPGIGSLLSRVALYDVEGVEAAVEDLFDRIVRGEREPHPMDY